MAILWKQWQQEQARQRVRLEVALAVYQYQHGDRRPFYRLHGYAGLRCDDFEMLELRKLLHEVSNDGSENAGAIELPQTVCGAVAERQEAIAADVPAGGRV